MTRCRFRILPATGLALFLDVDDPLETELAL
jgi:hypothetical protein